MSNKIDSMTNQYLQITGRPAKANAPQGSTPAATKTASDTAKSGDTVEVTESARSLQALEARLSEVSEVDQKRVDEVRSRIEDGNYEISSERVAQKMVAMDRSIPDEK